MGCELTLLRNNLGNATKVFDLDDKGALRKRSAANIYEGEAERLTITGLKELKDLIEGGYGLDDSTVELEQAIAPVTSNKS